MRLCKADKTLCVCVYVRACTHVRVMRWPWTTTWARALRCTKDKLLLPRTLLDLRHTHCRLLLSGACVLPTLALGGRGGQDGGAVTLQIVVVSLLNYPQLHVPPSTSMNFPLKTHFRPTRECSVPPTNMLQTLSPASPVITLASPCKGTSLSLSRVMSLGVSLLSLATGSEDGPQEDGRQGGWAEPPWFKC